MKSNVDFTAVKAFVARESFRSWLERFVRSGYFGTSCGEFTLNLRICHWSPCLIRPSVTVASPFSNVAFVAYCAEMTLPVCVVADMRACPCGGSYFWNRPRLPNQVNI